ncbi:MAG: hypothetical protein WEA61_04450 [Anaerolineales bacterium]
MVNVKQILFASRDPRCGSVELLTALNYMRAQEVSATGPEDEELEIVMVAIQVVAHLRTSEERSQQVLEAWRTVVPHGVLLGERLFRNGDLERMEKENMSASIMLESLAVSL